MLPLASWRSSLDSEKQKNYQDTLSMERKTLLTRLHRYYTATSAWPVRTQAAGTILFRKSLSGPGQRCRFYITLPGAWAKGY